MGRGLFFKIILCVFTITSLNSYSVTRAEVGLSASGIVGADYLNSPAQIKLKKCKDMFDKKCSEYSGALELTQNLEFKKVEGKWTPLYFQRGEIKKEKPEGEFVEIFYNPKVKTSSTGENNGTADDVKLLFSGVNLRDDPNIGFASHNDGLGEGDVVDLRLFTRHLNQHIKIEETDEEGNPVNLSGVMSGAQKH